MGYSLTLIMCVPVTVMDKVVVVKTCRWVRSLVLSRIEIGKSAPGIHCSRMLIINTLSPRGFQWSECVQQRSSHRLLTNSYTVTLRRPVQLTRAYSLLVSEPAKLHIKHEG